MRRGRWVRVREPQVGAVLSRDCFERTRSNEAILSPVEQSTFVRKATDLPPFVLAFQPGRLPYVLGTRIESWARQSNGRGSAPWLTKLSRRNAPCAGPASSNVQMRQFVSRTICILSTPRNALSARGTSTRRAAQKCARSKIPACQPSGPGLGRAV